MSLLEELKNYLDVTWTDEATDNKLNGILNRAGNILSSYAGEKLTFDTTPTKGSTNPVTSNGVKAYVDQAIASIVDADNKSY